MSLRADLERRPDVSDDDIADIIQIAHRLQREDEAEAQQLTVEDLGEIAEDLDIDRAYVEKAIELRRDARAKAEADARAKARQRQRVMVIAGISGAVVLALALILALVGSSSLSEQHDRVQEARGRLDQVLQRMAASAPQGLALVGGNPADLRAAVAEVQNAADLEARLEAARKLDSMVADSLAALPATEEPAASQRRLNLHYELTGFQNRIAAESQRLRAAESKYRAVRSSITGKLARLFGMGP